VGVVSEVVRGSEGEPGDPVWGVLQGISSEVL